MNVLFVAVGSLKSQNGYIVRISEEAKLLDKKNAYLCMFVPVSEYINYRKGITFPVVRLFSEVFVSIYILPTLGGFYFHSIKKLRINRILSKHNISRIHAESTASGFILARSNLSIGYTLDLHGFSEYETILRSKIKKRSWIHKKLAVLRALKLDRVSILGAKNIVAVSHAMKGHLVERFSIDVNKVSVTPCLASNSTLINNIGDWQILREKNRLTLGVSDVTTVLGYIGGLGTYQMVEEMLDFFKAYNKINNDSIFLLVVIGDSKQLMDMVTDKNMVEVVQIYTDIHHKEVGSYLCAMDFGLLFRKTDPVNFYASPTKFGEYLSCGVSMLVTLNIGDLKHYVQRNSLGIGISDDLKVDLELILKMEKIMYSRRKVAENNIDWIASEYTWAPTSIEFRGNYNVKKIDNYD